MSYETPTIEQLKSLIRWPEGTVGYQNELDMLIKMRALCEAHGYGRVPQIAAEIEDIWRNPENVEKYLKKQKEHNDLMEEYRKKVKDQNGEK
jgi:hypothetical protein